MSDVEIDSSIVTPVGSSGFIAGLFSGPGLLGLAARLVARFFRKPFRLGGRVVAASHADVRELLARDLDFGIAAINAAKIDEVNGGPFILGMDRSATLERERRMLYSALAEVDTDVLRAAVEADVARHLDRVSADGTLDAVGAYARPIAAHTAQRLFGIDGPDDQTFMEVARSIFGHTFLNLDGDPKVQVRGIKAGRLMQNWLAAEIDHRRSNGSPKDDLMNALMRQSEDDNGVRRALGGMLVGSVDTTATCVAKILTVIKRKPTLQVSMRQDMGDLDRLYGWCLEALRVWPHNPILMREATSDTTLGETDIKAGQRVIAYTQAAMLDSSVFAEPKRLRPDRDRAAYLHFGGGLHPCAGRSVNRFQIPILVRGLLERGIVNIGGIGWAGAFPHRLEIKLGGGTH